MSRKRAFEITPNSPEKEGIVKYCDEIMKKSADVMRTENFLSKNQKENTSYGLVKDHNYNKYRSEVLTVLFDWIDASNAAGQHLTASQKERVARVVTVIGAIFAEEENISYGADHKKFLMGFYTQEGRRNEFFKDFPQDADFVSGIMPLLKDVKGKMTDQNFKKVLRERVINPMFNIVSRDEAADFLPVIMGFKKEIKETEYFQKSRDGEKCELDDFLTDPIFDDADLLSEKPSGPTELRDKPYIFGERKTQGGGAFQQ